VMKYDEVRAAVEAALVFSNGEISVDNVMKGIHDGSYFVFEFESSIAVLTVIQYEDKKALRIAAASGSLTDVGQGAFFIFDKLARELACDFIEVFGRRGWAKQLKQYGYTEQYTVVTKQVEVIDERIV
jgi:hypothetical protein